ncbi:ATP-dependent RNA helicase [Planomonospora sp. ID82291]|uniref:ATP-dependent RNA helicase n=1 Tax=Planomonospora sp. ID82291 TaxID=2738136 RepID=UPI0018C38C70|nr:ATP-dependent helicase C-terminal domain-containing protein [Planomonospora sp. ID82291]MBG0813840.1 ATP-dependent helicase HrpB [Planomonospora sp. ID82291]
MGDVTGKADRARAGEPPSRRPDGSGGLRAAWSALPVRHALPELRAALDAHGAAVLVAPPGTGKTTLVPLALAGLLDGSAPKRVVVAEPRRMAVRAAARRMAWLLGSEVGAEVGFSVRGERRTGPGTVVEVVTTGVLLQRLQRDPELDGVQTVLLDECHERHLDADTALAFLLDVRAALRPDLRILAASATADAGPWARLLATGTAALSAAPVVRASGTAHPVTPVWAPPTRPVAPPHGLRVDPAFLAHVADVVRRALAEHDGDVLCFLPGVGEIGRVAGMLADLDRPGGPAETDLDRPGGSAETGRPDPGGPAETGGPDRPGGLRILQVHGQAPARVQDEVLSPAPGGARRVVLATSVAESSLTVPGVRIVVDSGLAREPRTDHARGLGSLTTVRVSRASAEQRAGRAGREAPGVVYRCWSSAEHDRLPEHARPEIALADLTGFALHAACWGDPSAEGLALLDPPPPAALEAAHRTLRALGALVTPDAPNASGALNTLSTGSAPNTPSTTDTPGTAADTRTTGLPVLSGARVTDRGRRMAAAGVHPRLARALLDGGDRAAEVVALLSEQLPRDAGDDLVAVWRAARRGGDGFSARWRREAGRLARAVPGESRAGGGAGGPGTPPERTRRSGAGGTAPERTRRSGAGGTAPERTRRSGADPGRPPGGRTGERTDDETAGRVVALAYPERVARRRGGAYLMASGTAAELPAGSRLGSAEWLAVAVADRPAGSAAARIRQAVVIDEETARSAAAPLYSVADEVAWRVPPGERKGDVTARRVERLGAVELSSIPLRDADVRPALLDGLRTEGPSLLRWTPEAVALRERLAFCRRALGDPWPAVDDAALVEAAGLWLEPELSRARRRADLERLDTAAALHRLVPWSARLDATAPERIEVPSGSRVRIDYSGERPVLAAKLQELFGWDDAPRIAGVPLVVHLLSPAGRPAAVTSDLASFWREGYRAVRAELRGRYPRHPWPEDPLSAAATRRTNPRR